MLKNLFIAFLLLSTATAFARDPVAVSQKNRAFTAQTIRLHPGDTIRFQNDDDFGHQVYTQSPAFSFDTDETDPGKHVDVTFPKAGDYSVLCHIHPRMRLDVIVK